MKKLLIVLFLLYCAPVFSQTLPEFDKVKLNSESDCQAADPVVLTATDYILATPFDKSSTDQKKALRFILKWIEGTPDYTFDIEEKLGSIFQENQALAGIYMACMAKFCLENKAASKSAIAVKVNSVVMMLKYAEKPGNNIEMTDSLKRLIDANNKGELSSEL